MNTSNMIRDAFTLLRNACLGLLLRGLSTLLSFTRCNLCGALVYACMLVCMLRVARTNIDHNVGVA